MSLDKLEKEISSFQDAINELEDIEIVITPESEFNKGGLFIKGLKMFLSPDEFKIETFYKNKSIHKITNIEELGVDNCLAFMRRIINDKIDLVKNNKLWNILDMEDTKIITAAKKYRDESLPYADDYAASQKKANVFKPCDEF